MSVGICVTELGDALKRTSLYPGRFALTAVAAAALYLTVPDAQALGLGRLNVQSALGESLRAEIDVTSITPEEAANLKVRIAPPESFRAAGVDYNAVLPATQVSLMRHPDGRPYLRITSDRVVQEPFVDVILEITWNTGRLVREYTLLFDPPARAQAAAPAPQSAPAMGSAPAAPPATAATPATPAQPRTAEARRPAPPRAPASAAADGAPATAAAKAPAGPAGDEYRVRPGDSLSRIAGRTHRQGVSLDQMLVSLYRGNSHAFIGNNMNRLRAGVVLSVPSAEAAKAVTPSEAREIIQAQSADFGAYRQRLAGGVPDARAETPSRQAGGSVQASIEDKRQAQAATPDKLTLSKGAAGSKAAVEEKIAREREKRDADTRVAELNKNLEDLKKLSGATAPAGKAPATGAPSGARQPGATLSAPITTPTAPAAPVAAAPVASKAAAPAATAVQASPAPAVSAASAAPATAATTPATTAATAAAATASAPVVATAPAAASAPAGTPDAATPAASAPVVAAAPTASAPAVAKSPAAAKAPAEEAGVLGALLDDNPWALGLGAAVVALLGGFGVYRFSRRSKKDSGETSFLESRLQPDSFFGASGGQRIDTRDAGGASSSMSYSLSQLDAIGDVDPVAEADVYLAYGRDLQAEEILKEAMRSTPDRLAIRTKLLEVYAKRRDTKGFELLATQLFALTHGAGEDWGKAQELGQQIDPENALYKPGGAPAVPHVEGATVSEPLGASTMPQSVLPSPSQFERAKAEMEPLQRPAPVAQPAPVAPAAQPKPQPAEAMDSGLLDLDLDLSLDSPAAPQRATPPVFATQPLPRGMESSPQHDDGALDFDPVMPELPAVTPAAAAPAGPISGFAMDFDLSAISLDLDGPGQPTSVPAPLPEVVAHASAGADLAGFDLGSGDAEGGDPLARKIELAEEFRQIGDMEGARDLLQEVVAKASGTLKSKAQGMLDSLA